MKILTENIQVQHDKRTVGELDCILIKDNTPIHLEIIYKFYLYDNSVGSSEIEHWIGPNRNDTLLKKLTKLKEKQLPLLYSEHTKPILDDFNLNPKIINQLVYFKAQLFTPYNILLPEFTLVKITLLRRWLWTAPIGGDKGMVKNQTFVADPQYAFLLFLDI
ncbi:DUF1853 family protein [Aureibaculum sp. 2210JD6-5]|uniref:DUF1853 family protein n=1 Tax=Aureibaculum sp. 2210JD6-5 TaxID=3103957 RepID=UPI0039F18DDF